MRDTSIYSPARRRAGLALLLLCTGLSWLAGPGTSTAQDKPATIQEVSYIAPNTLAQMLQSSDLIARVRITDAKQNVVVGVADAGIFTDLNATVVEVFKTKTEPVAAGAPIRILQEGGEAQVGSKRLRIVADFERLAKGKEYVLFLTWSKPSNAYQVNYGPDGAFEVLRGQKLRAIGKSTPATEQAGVDVAAFQGKLQTLIAQKR
jgi:hypothetical protein